MKCSVPGCGNVSTTQLSTQRKFHTFPSDPVQCNQWVEAIRHPRFDPKCTTVTSKHNLRVCSDHFKNDDYTGGQTDVIAALKRSAIPSVFPWSKTESESVSTTDVSQQPWATPLLLTFQLSSLVTGLGPNTLALPVLWVPGPSGVSSATRPAIDAAHKESLQSVAESQSNTLEKTETQKLPLDSLEIMEDNCEEGLSSIVEDFSPPPSPNPGDLAKQRNKAAPSDNSHRGTSEPSITAEIVVTVNEEESDSPDDGVGELEETAEMEETDELEEMEFIGDIGDSDDDDYSPEPDLLASEDSDSHVEGSGNDEPKAKPRGLCQECGIVFNNLKAHTCEFKIKPFSCNFCGKRFATELCLKTHSKTHEDGIEQRCQFCYVKFKTIPEKLAHEKSHSTEKPYQCPECPESFPNVQARNMHMKHHKVCRVCNMEFPRYNKLMRHMVVHTGIKPFVCDICQRSFNQPSHLRSHMRLHTGEKPFKCMHCDKSFNHNVSLKSHIQRYHSLVPGFEAPQSEGDEDDINTSDVKEGETSKDSRKSKWPSTGRPKGRPKRNAVDGDVKGDYTDSEMPYGGDENESSERVRKIPKRSEVQQDNSDFDFDPSEMKKKKVRGHWKSKGRGRGRPRKNPPGNVVNNINIDWEGFVGVTN